MYGMSTDWTDGKPCFTHSMAVCTKWIANLGLSRKFEESQLDQIGWLCDCCICTFQKWWTREIFMSGHLSTHPHSSDLPFHGNVEWRGESSKKLSGNYQHHQNLAYPFIWQLQISMNFQWPVKKSGVSYLETISYLHDQVAYFCCQTQALSVSIT